MRGLFQYLPIQNVISGELYFFARCSKYIHGLFSGRENVFPMMGNGNGPGGFPGQYKSLTCDDEYTYHLRPQV